MKDMEDVWVEVVDEDGKTYIEEAILGAIVSRTEVTEE